MPAAITIDAMTEEDADGVLAVYADGIATGNATFETSVPDWSDWSDRHLDIGRLVARIDGEVAGWASLSAVSSRAVYHGVAENSIYVASRFYRRGVANSLMAELVSQSEQAGFWTLLAGVFPENAASLALHKRHGFQVLGVRRRIGRMSHGPWKGQWRDVVLMQRRSEIVGLD